MSETLSNVIGTLSEEERDLIQSLRDSKVETSVFAVDHSLVSTVDIATLGQGLNDVVWVQNMSPAPSRFADAKLGSFMLEPYGRGSSIQQISTAFTRNPFLQRAEKRKKIRWVTDAEAREILDKVETVPEIGTANRLVEYLGKGAQENAGKRFIVELSDDAEQKKSISSDDIWAGQKTVAVKKEAKTDVVQDGPQSPASVLTAPVREGDWAVEIA